MFVAKLGGPRLQRHMDRVLRAVVQARVADLAVIRKRDLFLRHRDVVGRADFDADAAVNAAVIDRIGEGRVLPQPAPGQPLLVQCHLGFGDRGDPDLDGFACRDLGTNGVQLPLYILLRQSVDLLQFTALSGRRSVLERPLSGENGRTFLVNTPDIIGY